MTLTQINFLQCSFFFFFIPSISFFSFSLLNLMEPYEHLKKTHITRCYSFHRSIKFWCFRGKNEISSLKPSEFTRFQYFSRDHLTRKKYTFHRFILFTCKIIVWKNWKGINNYLHSYICNCFLQTWMTIAYSLSNVIIVQFQLLIQLFI